MKTMCRILCILTAAALMLCATALANTAVTNSYAPEGRSVSFNANNGTLAQIVSEDNGSYYVLTDANGNRLTTERYLMMNATGSFWKVAMEDGVNNIGLIDAGGNVVLPMQYGAVETISDKWVIGVTLTPATVDQYDYKSWDGEDFYLVSAYDVYFEGAPVGSLSRTAYYSAMAYGDYLYVKDKENNYHYYNSALAESGYVSESGNSEYEEVYKNGETAIWHRGSNQQAFTAGCTLTSDEVSLDIYNIDGHFCDLQGNTVFEFNEYYDYFGKFEGDYARFRAYGKYGLVDRSGNVVLPAEYDEITAYYMSNSNETCYFPCGYQAFVKDGKLGYADLNGNITCEPKYSADNAKYSTNPNFATLQDLDGSYIVLSAAVGELSERYSDVRIPSGLSKCFAAQNAAGQMGVVDIDGDTVLPFGNDVRNVDSYSFSKDGSIISGNNVYYTLNAAGDASEAESDVSESGGFEFASAVANLFGSKGEASETASNEEAPEKTDSETASSDGWTCDCGSVNSGNFCPQCGSARPEEKAAFCTNCGYQCEGETPNFCPQCGQKF